MIGLPKININFFGELKRQIKRSSDGTVALVLKDEIQAEKFSIIEPGEKVEGFTDENIVFIKQALAEGAEKVMIVSIGLEDGYEAGLDELKNKRFNYLALPGISELETDDVVDWIKAKREDNDKVFKVVLPNTAADHEGVINFTADEIEVGESVYNTSEYTARIAGLLAAMPYTRSSTYYVLPEVKSIQEVAKPDEAVDNGEMILINDGEKVKIGRGVNSLTVPRTEEKQTDDFRSIRIVEILDMIRDEVQREFADNYVGKVPNFYDNQVLYFSEINEKFKELEALQLLDPTSENYVRIDVEAQRQAWKDSGKDITGWDDERVKINSFRRNVFLTGNIRPLETMEDLDLNIRI